MLGYKTFGRFHQIDLIALCCFGLRHQYAALPKAANAQPSCGLTENIIGQEIHLESG